MVGFLYLASRPEAPESVEPTPEVVLDDVATPTVDLDEVSTEAPQEASDAPDPVAVAGRVVDADFRPLVGTRLVVVMGHSDCGAVGATIQELERPSGSRSPNLRSIVNRIRPSVQALFEMQPRLDRETLMRQAVRANIRTSVSQLQNGSQILESLIQGGGLLVVGAEYSLETGEVEFFEGVPDA